MSTPWFHGVIQQLRTDHQNDMMNLWNDLWNMMRAEILPDLKQVLSFPLFLDIADFQLL
jgi:hypothetical protein